MTILSYQPPPSPVLKFFVHWKKNMTAWKKRYSDNSINTCHKSPPQGGCWSSLLVSVEKFGQLDLIPILKHVVGHLKHLKQWFTNV